MRGHSQDPLLPEEVRLKRLVLIVLASTLLLPLSHAVAADPLPSPRNLLDQVIGNLPKEPLDLYGRIVTRKRRGIVVQSLAFQMTLRWGATPAQATYTLLDPSGVPLEQLVETWQGTKVSLAYSTGNPLQEAAMPSMQASVRGTDFSWSDLTLSFLWWTPGDKVVKDSFKGRDCFVMEVAAPENGADSVDQAPVYKRVKLWIDTKAGMMLKSEALDANGKEVRSLWVWSIKQIGETWMIKDLEIKEPDSSHRTSVIVDRIVNDGKELKTK